MKRHAKKAYNKLIKMGVQMAHPSWAEPNGHFAISGEDDHGDHGNLIISYYDYEIGEFGVDQKVCDVLRKNGLFCEWVNPGVLAVYDA